jgi:diaminopimelate decarboxylase
VIIQSIKGLEMSKLCEPGRFMVDNDGQFFKRVLYENINGKKRFVIVDGAMNDLLRPSLYNAYHRIEALGVSGDVSDCDVVGPVCESGDFLGKNVALPPLKHNDILAVHSSGAYGFTMSSNYNTRARAAEVAIEGGEDRLIRARESYEDQIRLEKEYLQD